MRRISERITSIVMLMNILFFSSFYDVSAYDNLFSGTKNSKSVVEEMQFNDVSSLGRTYWARDAVYTMAALGIVKGFDGQSFFPSISVSRVQALAFIYRAMSYEDQANSYAKVIAEQRKTNPGKINNTEIWADGYVQLAYNQGLITNNQYEDAMIFDQGSLGDNDFIKSGEATRQEVAFWTAKVFRLTPNNTAYYAKLNGFSDGGAVKGEIAPYFEAILNAQIMKGNNGSLYPERSITREEMAQVLLNGKSYILENMGIKEYTGIIDSISNRSKINILRDNGVEDCIDIGDSMDEGLVVIGTVQIGGADILTEGVKISYYANRKNQVIFVKTMTEQNGIYIPTDSPSESYVTSGIVQNINVSGLTITLYDESGLTNSDLYRKFNVADTSSLKVLNNNKASKLSEIYPQDKVFIKVVDGYVKEISFSRSSLTIYGTVTNKADNVIVVLKDNSQTQKLSVKSNSKFYEQNTQIEMSDINVGSKVRVDVSTNSAEYIINRLDVQKEFSINNIYKAVFDSYDDLGSKLVVKDIMRMESNNWGYTAHKGFVEFEINPVSNIYCDNEVISLSNLVEYTGMEIYIATQNGINGEEKVAFARINTSGNNKSQVYKGEIDEVYSSSKKLNIEKYNKTFNAGYGTAFVKNGKLVSINELSASDNAYVVAVGTGSGYNTFVVYVDENIATDKIDVLYGEVVRIDVGDKIVVETNRVYDLIEGDWISSSRKVSYKINSKTRILNDKGIVNNRDITSFSTDGSGEVNVNLVVSNGEALVVSIGDGAKYVMTGKVSSITKDTTTVSSLYIYGARQYSEGLDEWEELDNGILAVQKNTIYLKNGNVIFDTDIREGDSFTAFYNGRNSKTALIININ